MVVTAGRLRLPFVPILMAAGAMLYAVLLSRYVETVAGGADSSGYLNDAHILANGHVRSATRHFASLPAERVPNYLYAPLGFKPVNDRPEEIVPVYPPGFPLLVAFAHLFMGWEYAAKVVIVLHGVAGVFITYVLGRSLALRQWWAAAGALVLAASPLYFLNSLQPTSDLPALVWTSAALFCGMNAHKKGWMAIAAGFTFGFSVLIRPNCITTILALAVFNGASWRRWLLFALGGIPSAAFLLLYNHAAYGSALVTGYGSAAGMFDVAGVPAMLAKFAYWLPFVFTPAVCVFPLVILPGTAPGRLAWGLAACVGAYVIFYAAYVVHGSWTWLDLRFLLPISPALIVGSACVWQRIGARVGQAIPGRARRWPALRICGAGLALVLIGYFQLRQCKRIGVLDNLRGEPTYELACRWINEHLPPNSALVSMQFSGAAYHYTPMIVLRYDQIDRSNFGTIFAAGDAEGRPIYAVLFDWEQQEALVRRMPCGWVKVKEIGDATIWRRKGGISRSLN